MVAPAQVFWKSVMACSMAFFWADEPSPFRVTVPGGQAAVVVPPLPLEEAFEGALALLLEPQPDRANVPTRATPVTLASRRRDWIFTLLNLSTAGVNTEGVGARRIEIREVE